MYKEPNVLPESLKSCAFRCSRWGHSSCSTPHYTPGMSPSFCRYFRFLLTSQAKDSSKRSLWPWIALTIAVPFSYLTYIDPLNFREFFWFAG